ncbi:MAG TPA: T9SS type A sorting domain-containing protein [Cyclobacteriaceae bacterium]
MLNILYDQIAKRKNHYFTALSFLTLFLTTVIITNAQTQTFNFSYIGPTIPPSCNPFDTEGNFTDPWLPSHGSPQAGDVYGQNVFNKARLVGKWQAGDSKEKGEGLYIEYNFLSNHIYDITIVLAHDKGDVVGLDVFAVNGLSQNSNSSCSEDEIPDNDDKKEIYATNMVYDGPPGNFEEVVRTFNPGKDYKYLWLLSRQYTYQANGSLFVDQIVIADKGVVETSPSSPTCPVKLETDPLALKLSPVKKGNNRFGRSVSADGNYFAVGAYGERRVYIYKKVACSVELKAILSGDNDYSGGRFGWSVDVHGDQVIIGDPGKDSYGGAVYIFKRNDETWTRVAKFTSKDVDYGFSVAIHESFAIVGSPKGTGGFGTVFFYERLGTDTWGYHTEFAGKATNIGFGYSVDIKRDAAIATATLTTSGDHRGNNRVYFFERVNKGTSIWVSKVEYGAPKDNFYDFGVHAELSEDGQAAFVTNPSKMGSCNQCSYSSTKVFKLVDNTWRDWGGIPDDESNTWSAFAVSQNHLVIPMYGEISIFERDEATWNSDLGAIASHSYSEITDIKNAGYNVGDVGDTYINTLSVSMTNDYIVLGYPEPYCNFSGHVYVYDLFAALHNNNLKICGKSYGGSVGEINARTISAGCDGVNFLDGSSANYKANVIRLTPGFNAKRGSAFSATATGCSFGTIAENARVASNEKTDLYSDIIKEAPVQLEEQHLSVFPNPTTNGSITVASTYGGIESIAVYNLQGVLVSNIQMDSKAENSVNIQLPQNAHSIYLIKVLVNNKIFMKKISFQ